MTPGFDWRRAPSGTKLGASPAALDRLAGQLGYRLVGSNIYGFNLCFARNDVGVETLPTDRTRRALPARVCTAAPHERASPRRLPPVERPALRSPLYPITARSANPSSRASRSPTRERSGSPAPSEQASPNLRCPPRRPDHLQAASFRSRQALRAPGSSSTTAAAVVSPVATRRPRRVRPRRP